MDEPGEQEAGEKDDQGEEGNGDRRGDGRRGQPKMAQQHQKDHMGEIDAEAALGQPAGPLSAGALVAQAQHIPEEDKNGHRHGADVGREIAVKRDVQSAGAPGEEGGAQHGKGPSGDAQRIDEPLGQAAQGIGLQIVARQIIPHEGQGRKAQGKVR